VNASVRRVSTNISVGTLFAFVSTGFLIREGVGGVYGYLSENFVPNYIFYASAIFSFLGIGTLVLNNFLDRMLKNSHKSVAIFFNIPKPKQISRTNKI